MKKVIIFMILFASIITFGEIKGLQKDYMTDFGVTANFWKIDIPYRKANIYINDSGEVRSHENYYLKLYMSEQSYENGNESVKRIKVTCDYPINTFQLQDYMENWYNLLKDYGEIYIQIQEEFTNDSSKVELKEVRKGVKFFQDSQVVEVLDQRNTQY